MATKVLIIEDQLERSTQLSTYLENHHYLVTTIFNWEAEFEQLCHLQSDVVVIDLPLTGSKGLELYKRLKRDWGLAHRPSPLVIFFNRERSLSFLRKAYQAGVDFILEQETAGASAALPKLWTVVEALLVRERKPHFARV
jgi:CheY-like chemotaxis protein